jgi:hypothetical protein
MPRNILLEIAPIDPATSLPVILRMSHASVRSDAGYILDEQAWAPIITATPVFKLAFSEGGVSKALDVSYGDVEFLISPEIGNTDWSRLSFTGALGTMWVGEVGDPFTSYTKIWTGSLGPLSREGIAAKLALLGQEQLLDKPLLSNAYAGTGGVEGPAALLGTLKPWCSGTRQNVTPILVDPIYRVFQVHGYGAVQAIPMVYEAAMEVAATSAGNFGSFAALTSATLVPGQWATCHDLGLFRLGGQNTGDVTADVSGAKNGAAFPVTIGAIVQQLLTRAGVTNIDATSFNAATSNYSLYEKEQTTIGEIVRSALLAGDRYLIADTAGKFWAGRFASTKTPISVNSTRSSLPLVKTESIRQVAAAPPAGRVSVGHSPNSTVMSASSIAPALINVQADIDAIEAAATITAATANQAAADAALSLTRLASIGNDNVLDRTDKLELSQKYAVVLGEYAAIVADATALAISTERTAYITAYNTLTAYVGGLSPAYSNTAADTTIVGATFNTNFQNYYLAKQTLLNKIASEAAKRADWTFIPPVPATKLAISGGILDPLLADNSYWALTSNAAFSTTIADFAALGANKAITNPAGGNSNWFSAKFPVSPGRPYVVGAQVLLKTGYASNCIVSIRWYDIAGGVIISADASKYYQYAASPIAADTVITASTSSTAPDNASHGAIQFLIQGSIANQYYAGFPFAKEVATASQISVSNTTNMVPDANFSDLNAWTVGGTAARSLNTTTGEGSGTYKWTVNITTAGSVTAQTVECQPDTTYYVGGWLKYLSGTTGSVLGQVRWFNAANAQITAAQWLNTNNANTIGRIKTRLKSPANAVKAVYRFFWNAGGGDGRVFELSEPFMRPATALGQDIVREDGTTLITDATAITASGTSAFVANQGALCTKSSVDLSTSDVTGKSLANLDSTANTKLGGIATGATKNIVTRSTSAPASPVDGDTWVDTSVMPNLTKLRVSGAWQIGANYVTDTAQIADGAGLGATANWTNVVSRPTNLAGLDSSASTKLGTIATGATVGADLLTNVANRSLANLDATASTKLAGIATGAQVNPANLAALDGAAATKLSTIEANADVTANAAVTVVPPLGFTVYRTWEGAVKADQLPVDHGANVTKGGNSIRTDNGTSYAITANAGLTGKVTVNNTNGSSAKGTLTFADTITSGGTVTLTVTVAGVAYGPFPIEVRTQDDIAPIDNGAAGGSDNSLESIATTSYAVMTGQDVDDPQMDVAITSGQTLKLTAVFTYTKVGSAANYMVCIGQYSADNGATWTDMGAAWQGSETYRLWDEEFNYYEIVPGEMNTSWTVTGLSTGTYKVRLQGKKGNSSTGNLFVGSGAATSSRFT